MSLGKYTCTDDVTLQYSVAVRTMTMVTSLQT